jgi:hypothetical protein
MQFLPRSCSYSDGLKEPESLRRARIQVYSSKNDSGGYSIISEIELLYQKTRDFRQVEHYVVYATSLKTKESMRRLLIST